MGRVNTPVLDEKAKAELDKRFRTDKSYAVRNRCQLVLLKAESRSSKEVANMVKMCEMSVNNWVNRYKAEGLQGLTTKPGGGPKPLIISKQDQEMALTKIKENRQRLATAKAEWEAQQGKTVGRDTFRAFLKSWVGATNESENG